MRGGPWLFWGVAAWLVVAIMAERAACWGDGATGFDLLVGPDGVRYGTAPGS